MLTDWWQLEIMTTSTPQPQSEYPYRSQPALQPGVEPLQLAALKWPLGPSWFPLLMFALVVTGANLAVVPLIDVFNTRSLGLIFPITCLGVMLAEGFILAAWLVWGAGSFFKRLLIHWAAVAWLALAWLLGAILDDGFSGEVRDGLENVPFVLPLLSVAIQLPLWIARYYFGWRLIDRCGDPSPEKPLGIRDLLVATSIVAVSLALIRLPEDWAGEDAWMAWGIIVPALAGISLVSVLPVAVWMLHVRNLAIGLVCIPVQTTIAIVVTLIVVAMMERIVLGQALVTGALVVGFAATLSVAALAARAAGYRLQIGLNAP
jgi:hypothetical protein